MSIVSKSAAFIKGHAPPGVFKGLKAIYQGVARPGKYRAEMDFWLMRHQEEHGRFENAHYGINMRAMARCYPDSLFDGKVVVDFGCGPRGSLAWLSDRAFCIGVDVLADEYLRCFPDDVRQHNMAYVLNSESHIPLPTASADIVVSMNSLDHVDSLSPMCAEILRIMKPGAVLLGSFNLDEEPTPTEPLVLTEHVLRNALLDRFDQDDLRVIAKCDGKDNYGPFHGRPADGNETGARILWFAGRRKPA